jgi:hypothetical protein
MLSELCLSVLFGYGVIRGDGSGGTGGGTGGGGLQLNFHAGDRFKAHAETEQCFAGGDVVGFPRDSYNIVTKLPNRFFVFFVIYLTVKTILPMSTLTRTKSSPVFSLKLSQVFLMHSLSMGVQGDAVNFTDCSQNRFGLNTRFPILKVIANWNSTVRAASKILRVSISLSGSTIERHAFRDTKNVVYS